jgi:hypothetical protein
MTYTISLDFAGDMTFFELSDILSKYNLTISHILLSGPAGGNPEISLTTSSLDNIKNFLTNDYLIDFPDLPGHLDFYLKSVIIK